MTYDLHIHSCLSPCGDNEMTVNNIVNMAMLKELDVIALTDHNSSRNCPAFMEAARRAGIRAIPGMEINTSEEIHAVCLFPTLEQAMEFDSYVFSTLPPVKNKPEIFGDQIIVNEEDEPIGSIDTLLITASGVSYSELPELMAQYGGIFFPSHIDRSSNSLVAIMGAVPEDVEFPFYEFYSLVGRSGSFKPKANTVGTAFKIGAPMGLQHLLMGSAQVVSTLIVAPLGTVAIAAHSLAITVESLCYMPGFGIAEAATTLVGQGIGAGQRLLTRSFAYMSVGLGIMVMTLMGVLMWIFAPELMGIMSPVEEVIAQGTQVLRIEAWAEPMFAAAIVANGVFIGAGDTMVPAAMSLCSMWLVRLTLAASLAPKFGLKGVWTAMAIELIFRGIIFLIRLFKGGWANKLKLKMEN